MPLAPALLEPEEAPEVELPDGPPEAPCSLLVALAWRAPVILQSAGSVACLVLSQRSPIAFECASPLLSYAVLTRPVWAEPCHAVPLRPLFFFDLALPVVSFEAVLSFEAVPELDVLSFEPVLELDVLSFSLVPAEPLLDDLSSEAALPEALLPAALDFWPERVAAGVFVAFSCARPEELMFEVALSSPVDFDALPLEPVSLDEDALGLALLEPFIEALPLAPALPLVPAVPLIEEPALLSE